MILGHLTATYALSAPLGRRYPVLTTVGPLLFGAYLPDILDKPLNILLGLPGRGLGHSAVLLALVFYLLIRAVPARRRLLIPLAVGAFLHLAQDLTQPATLLWPLMGSWHQSESITLLDNVWGYYFHFDHPGQLALEIASYPFCLYLLLRRRAGGAVESEVSAASALPD